MQGGGGFGSKTVAYGGDQNFTFKGFNECFKIARIGKRDSLDSIWGTPSSDLIRKQSIYIMACKRQQENKVTHNISKFMKKINYPI